MARSESLRSIPAGKATTAAFIISICYIAWIFAWYKDAKNYVALILEADVNKIMLKQVSGGVVRVKMTQDLILPQNVPMFVALHYSAAGGLDTGYRRIWVLCTGKECRRNMYRILARLASAFNPWVALRRFPATQFRCIKITGEMQRLLGNPF